MRSKHASRGRCVARDAVGCLSEDTSELGLMYGRMYADAGASTRCCTASLIEWLVAAVTLLHETPHACRLAQQVRGARAGWMYMLQVCSSPTTLNLNLSAADAAEGRVDRPVGPSAREARALHISVTRKMLICAVCQRSSSALGERLDAIARRRKWYRCIPPVKRRPRRITKRGQRCNIP